MSISRKPQQVAPDCWYYEEKDHIALVLAETQNTKFRHGALLVKIPARLLRASVARMQQDKTTGRFS